MISTQCYPDLFTDPNSRRTKDVWARNLSLCSESRDLTAAGSMRRLRVEDLSDGMAMSMQLGELAELLASSSKITSRLLDPLIMFALAASSQLAALAFYTIYMKMGSPIFVARCHLLSTHNKWDIA